MKNLSSLGAYFCALIATTAACFGQNATTLTTVPVGYVSIPLTDRTVTAMSLPLQPAAVFASKVTSVGNASISDSAANFTTLGNLTNTHYVRIKSGNAAGRELVVTGITGNNTLNLSQGTGSFALPVTGNGTAVNVAANDKYELVPMFTLAEVFGAGTVQDPVALKSGATAALADQVTLYVDGTNTSYFHNGTNWRNANPADTANYNTKGIPPHAGIGINRKPNGVMTQIDFTGTVASTPARFQLPGGSKTLIPISSPVGTTLTNLNFLAMTSWTRSDNPKNADQVTVYRPNKTMAAYYLNTQGVWRNAGNPADLRNYGSTLIPAGSGLWIVRRGAAVGTVANVASTLPYSL